MRAEHVGIYVKHGEMTKYKEYEIMKKAYNKSN